MARLLREIAAEVLGEERARKVWSRMDIIGDILVIKSPRIVGVEDDIKLDEYVKIAEKVVERLPYVRSVWLAVEPVVGDERLRRRLVHLAGERRTTTIYREHGCRFIVDIARVFVTPRLNFEHIRVARKVSAGERVLNMFAGAGIFSIIIACKSKPQVVHSIDINPEAYKLIIENAKLNKVEEVVRAYLGDAARVIEDRLESSVDRVLMPLPRLALDYLPYALRALSGGGVLHVYVHVRVSRGERPEDIGARVVSGRLEELGVKSYSVAESRVVRPVGPRTYQVVVDVEVRRVD